MQLQLATEISSFTEARIIVVFVVFESFNLHVQLIFISVCVVTIKQTQRGDGWRGVGRKTCTLFNFAALSSYHKADMWRALLSVATVDVLFCSHNASARIACRQTPAFA